jgi:hypothetical protein
MTLGRCVCGERVDSSRDEREDWSRPGRHSIDPQRQIAALTLVAGELATVVLVGRFGRVVVQWTGVRRRIGHSGGGDLQAERQLKRN